MSALKFLHFFPEIVEMLVWAMFWPLLAVWSLAFHAYRWFHSRFVAFQTRLFQFHFTRHTSRHEASAAANGRLNGSGSDGSSGGVGVGSSSMRKGWMPLEHGPLYYQTSNGSTSSGRLLLLIPSLPLHTSDNYTSFAVQLATQLSYSVILFDPYCTGHSYTPPIHQHPATHLASVVQLLDSLGIDGPITVLAHGSGCVLGMAMAAEFPERVSRLVLVSPMGMSPLPSLPSLPSLSSVSVPKISLRHGLGVVVWSMVDPKQWTRWMTYLTYLIILYSPPALQSALLESTLNLASVLSYALYQLRSTLMGWTSTATLRKNNGNGMMDLVWDVVLGWTIGPWNYIYAELKRWQWLCDTLTYEYSDFSANDADGDQQLQQQQEEGAMDERIVMRRRALLSLLRHYPFFNAFKPVVSKGRSSVKHYGDNAGADDGATVNGQWVLERVRNHPKRLLIVSDPADPLVSPYAVQELVTNVLDHATLTNVRPIHSIVQDETRDADEDCDEFGDCLSEEVKLVILKYLGDQVNTARRLSDELADSTGGASLDGKSAWSILGLGREHRRSGSAFGNVN